MTTSRPQTRRVGILGAGYIADWHLRALRAVRGVRVEAICDVNRDRATSLAGKFRIANAFGNLAEMLEGNRCDVVHVLLPPNLHFQAASEILAADCHVYLEKPACVTAQECDELADLARQRGLTIGVGHNLLFAPVYERLRADVRGGALGPIREVEIVWDKLLGQIKGGPLGSWLFHAPGNVMLEIGPHSIAHLLDLVGPPDRLSVTADQTIEMPNGQPFHRRWQVRAWHGSTAVSLEFALGGGYQEHRIHVRGLIGSATVDFEAGTYVLRRHRPKLDDFDRHAITRGEGLALIRQARRKILRYAASKFKLIRLGNDFGRSIAGGMRAFYAGLGTPTDTRLSIEFAREVVALGQRLGAEVQCSPLAPREDLQCSPLAPREDLQRTSLVSQEASKDPLAEREDYTKDRPDAGKVLVLGGTGFIGQALVRQLVESGYPVRLLARDPRNLPRSLHGLPLEAIRGDMADLAGLTKAMEGVTTVCHLARAHVETWPEYVEKEIGGTRNVAEACLKSGVGRLIYTGTIDSYYTGDPAVVIRDDTPLDPKIERRNLYARAKAESEKLLLELQKEEGLPLGIFRPGVVIGPGGSPFHWGVGMWFADSVCQVWGKDEHPLPLVLASDVARALVRAVDAEGVIGGTFNLVGEPLLSAREYLDELQKAAGVRLDVHRRSALSFYLADMCKYVVKVLIRHPGRRLPSYRDWYTRSHRSRFDCSGAKKTLGWLPTGDRETMIREGIQIPAEEWKA